MQNFEFQLTGAYSGTTVEMTPTHVGFNWGGSIHQNGTVLIPFILCNDSLDVIAYGNTRGEQHEWYPTLYFEVLDGSDETPEIWGAWEICKKESDSYSQSYYEQNE
jgi:hypothetical protein